MPQYVLVGGQRSGQFIESDGSLYLRIFKREPSPPRPLINSTKLIPIEYDEYKLRVHSVSGRMYVLTSLGDAEATRELEKIK